MGKIIRLAGLFVLVICCCYPVFSEPELLLYLPFEEGEGLRVNDRISGLAGRIGLREGEARWVSGVKGQALHLDGREAGCSHVLFAQSDTARFFGVLEEGPFSISIWVKPDSAKSTEKMQDILNASAGDHGPGWRLLYHMERVRFRTGAGSGSSREIMTNPNFNKLSEDAWNHIVVVRNDEGMLSVYLNGEHAVSSEEPFEVISAGNPLTVGAFQRGRAYGFHGAVDEVRLYRGELTGGEIYEIYREGSLAGSLGIKLDGVMDDRVWEDAQKFSPFYDMATGKEADVQTEALFAYDNDYLYFGFEIHEPRMEFLRNEGDNNVIALVYGDDCVEIMLDTENTGDRYYQILINPGGYYGVIFRDLEDNVSTQLSGFRIYTATRVLEDRWIVEAAIPYSSISRSSIGNKMAVNLARNRRVDLRGLQESSVAEGGNFHKPDLFKEISVRDADFKKYAVDVSPPELDEIVYRDGRVELVINADIVNRSGIERYLKVSLGELGKGLMSPGADVRIEPGENRKLSYRLPFDGSGEFQFFLNVWEEGSVIKEGFFPLDITFVPLSLGIRSPFYRNSIYATEKLEEIKAVLHLADELLEGSIVSVTLADSSGNNIYSERHNALSGKMELSITKPPLDYGEYILTAAVLKDGEVSARTSEIIRKLRPAAGNEVRIDENLNMILNGEPFFPAVWWSVRHAIDQIPQTGADGVVGGFARDNRPFLNMLQEHDLYGVIMLVSGSMRQGKQREFWVGQSVLSEEAVDYITEAVNLIKDHPSLLAYYLVDEPVRSLIKPSILEESYRLIKSLDPHTPVLICIDSKTSLHEYRNALDMFFPDPYPGPMSDGSFLRPLTFISDFMISTQNAGAGRKFIGFTPQVFSFSDHFAGRHPEGRAPTFTELRCMQYLGIVHGARGLKFYNYRDALLYPDLYAGMPYIIREIKSLAPVILEGEELKGGRASSDDIHFTLLEKDGHLFIFAVNISDRAKEVRFDLPGVAGNLKVVSDGRRVTSRGYSFVDDFLPYGVNIYTTDIQFPEAISLNEALETVKEAGGIGHFPYAR